MNWNEVEKQIADGWINRQRHETANLSILNYSNKTQIEWHWTPETKACRGLIVNDHGEIVARPFEKFFSYEQMDKQVPDEPFEAFEKMDGSLGIVYWIDDKPFVSTRGSFVSDQAKRATSMLRSQYSEVNFDRDLTYLVEIIYPENRIVVDYAGRSELTLLAVIETKTGIEQPIEDIGLPVVKRHNISDLESILATQDSNREGFVLRFESGQRVKIKFDEYKRLHKIVTGLTEKSIWELLRSGDNFVDLLEGVPDEFYDWAITVSSKMNNQYGRIQEECLGIFESRPETDSRREIAEYFRSTKYPSILFSMLDDKPFADAIWKAIKPTP